VLLVDYGEVISQPQPADAVAEMASLTRLEVPEFVERYWRHRPDYDRGGEAYAFWSTLMGDDALDAATNERLIRLDVDSWQLLNAETVELLEHARGRGYSLSILSNAPHELANVLHDHPSLAFFDHLIFSAEIGVVKPEPAAFEAAVQILGQRPQDVLFIDDRPANVQGAADAGLRALRFTSVPALRAELFA
jgi:putative hydrolase of the HAD superfamily